MGMLKIQMRIGMHMNIPQTIAALAEFGFSQAAIARAVGASQPTINRAANGADVRFSTGRAIEQLYQSSVTKSAQSSAQP
jgi:predicted XRE-type DNA-binding protein